MWWKLSQFVIELHWKVTSREREGQREPKRVKKKSECRWMLLNISAWTNHNQMDSIVHCKACPVQSAPEKTKKLNSDFVTLLMGMKCETSLLSVQFMKYERPNWIYIYLVFGITPDFQPPKLNVSGPIAFLQYRLFVCDQCSVVDWNHIIMLHCFAYRKIFSGKISIFLDTGTIMPAVSFCQQVIIAYFIFQLNH